MKIRAFLPGVALAAAIVPLTGCVSPNRTLAADDGLRLEPCEELTGSRIRSSARQCRSVGYPFRSFSAEQLQSTGEIDIVEALRQLDPAFR